MTDITAKMPSPSWYSLSPALH